MTIFTRIGAVALVSFAGVACGCSGSATNDTPLAPGFYRHADKPTIYDVTATGVPCVVGNPPQLIAMGGAAAGAVHVVDPSTTIVPEGAPQTQCSWPTGYYRVGATNELVRIAGLKGCTAKRLPPGAVQFKVATRADLAGVVVAGGCTRSAGGI